MINSQDKSQNTNQSKKKISLVTPCYNEEENVEALWVKIKEIMSAYPQYDYEHIYIDNCSQDKTVSILRGICAKDNRVKVVVNARNFGHIRSPQYGMLQASGDAIILLASDFQDPPDLIPKFIAKWEEGFRIVLGVKTNSEETALMFFVRNVYYNLISKLAEVKVTKNNTGFGLYDRSVMEIVRKIDDPYPYFRGMISDIGFEQAKIEYLQPRRVRGLTKNNFYTLYDMAILGITNHSRVPLRIATLSGFLLSAISAIIAITYLILKLIFWDWFVVGSAPILIGLFFFSSVQLFFIGIIGEYIGFIYTQVQKRPLVIESERINF